MSYKQPHTPDLDWTHYDIDDWIDRITQENGHGDQPIVAGIACPTCYLQLPFEGTESHKDECKCGKEFAAPSEVVRAHALYHPKLRTEIMDVNNSEIQGRVRGQ